MLEEQESTSTEAGQPQQTAQEPEQIARKTEKVELMTRKTGRKSELKKIKTIQLPVKKKPVHHRDVVQQKTKELPLAPETTVQSSPIEMSTEAHDSYFSHKVVLLVAIAALLFFNQMQIGTVTALLDVSVPISTDSGNSLGSILSFTSSGDLDDVDVTTIKSTAQGIAVLFPVSEIKTTDDAVTVMIPSGIPEYGEAMGVSFDDPVIALEKLAGAYSSLKKMAKEDPAVWERYLSLAAAPRGIACEFCCGVGAQGVDSSGNLRCGCSHNPAVQSVTLWLMMNTDYSDAEILKEVYNWKSIWFPKNMVSLALDIAGGDTSVLEDLPGMVGGC